MWYAIVFRDHDGDWHAVNTVSDWGYALITHAAVAATLTALDYYDDVPPDVLKIIAADSAGQEAYQDAPALRSPLV